MRSQGNKAVYPLFLYKNVIRVSVRDWSRGFVWGRQKTRLRFEPGSGDVHGGVKYKLQRNTSYKDLASITRDKWGFPIFGGRFSLILKYKIQ